ncbi:hypothetical protein BV898_16343 [Hypsibius exemplaris]|uniref:Tc1-like transposase DDE domain-containing protein n=1 Tax=Hypsibius exemplaris TaxID=2072580 RepID=A0A9X6ND25_HYPEX|nr:hypothetical protein BV898_16343 [Hypsibius exemplaris]
MPKKAHRKAKRRKKQPMRKVTPVIVQRMVRTLIIRKVHHSFRSMANVLQLGESTDKAPCDAAQTVQAFLEEEMPCFIRNADIPPNSPDLNPFYYCARSLLKKRVNNLGLIASFYRLAKILKDKWEGSKLRPQT